MDGGSPPSAPPEPPARISILGGEVDVVTPWDVLDFTARRVAEGRRGLVANHNLHSLALLPRTPAMRAFYAMADLTEAVEVSEPVADRYWEADWQPNGGIGNLLHRWHETPPRSWIDGLSFGLP